MTGIPVNHPAGDFPAALGDPPAARWAAAVAARHSMRTYTGAPVASPLLEGLQSLCEGLSTPELVRIVVVREAPAEVFTGVLGGYGRVLGAPSALLVIGTETAPAVQEAAGYLGEAVILEATSLNLGTCWIAGFFDRELASSLVALASGESVLAISPVGYARSEPRPGERWMKRLARSHKRRSVEQIAPGFDPEVWPAWATSGLRLAQAAPSAANRQPWRFWFEPGFAAGARRSGDDATAGAVAVTVATGGYEGGVSRRLDCGIAMLHFEVGARAAGVRGRWESLEAPGVARYQVDATTR